MRLVAAMTRVKGVRLVVAMTRVKVGRMMVAKSGRNDEGESGEGFYSRVRNHCVVAKS